MNTKQIGEISQLAVAASLAKAGWTILMPYGDNQRYDLVIEKDGRFHRVQCKTGRLIQERDVVVADLISGNSLYGTRRRSYEGQIEFFGIYCPQLDKAYLIPIENAPDQSITLRLAPTLNKQTRGCRMASDYEINISLPVRAENPKIIRPSSKDRERLESKKCSACQKVFQPRKRTQNFCSIMCAKDSKRRYALTDVELLDRLKTTSPERLGQELGVSGTAIRKRLVKIREAG